jgi:REP element-mobilizing transposase RayT
MVKYRRNKLDSMDAIYFLTMSLKEQKPWFKSNSNAEIGVHVMNHIIEKYRIIFHVWVLMPDHISWLINPTYQS